MASLGRPLTKTEQSLYASGKRILGKRGEGCEQRSSLGQGRWVVGKRQRKKHMQPRICYKQTERRESRESLREMERWRARQIHERRESGKMLKEKDRGRTRKMERWRNGEMET